MTTIARVKLSVSGRELVEGMRKEREFKADRLRYACRLVYMTQADGFVMVRYLTCRPFCIAVEEWEALPLAEQTAKGKS